MKWFFILQLYVVLCLPWLRTCVAVTRFRVRVRVRVTILHS